MDNGQESPYTNTSAASRFNTHRSRERARYHGARRETGRRQEGSTSAASRSNTRRSQERSRYYGDAREQPRRRQNSTSTSYRRRTHPQEGLAGSPLEERVRRMEESQNEILHLLREARRLLPDHQERIPPQPNTASARGVPTEELRPAHPQEGPQHENVEILDTASSLHPSRDVQQGVNTPAPNGNSTFLNPLHQKAMLRELRRLVREEFPSRIRDTHTSHSFKGSSPLASSILQSPIPKGFKLPNMDSYEGINDPYEHVDHYRTIMHIQGASDAVLCQVFPATLKGQARSWFYSLPAESIYCFDELARLFTEQFIANRRILKDSSHLSGIRQNEGESLRDYFQRFSSEARQIPGVDPELLRGVLLGGLRPGPFYSALMRDTVHTYADLIHRIEAQISADEAINAHRQQFEQSSGKRKNVAENTDWPAQRQRPDQRRSQDPSQRLPQPPRDFQPVKNFTPLTTSRANILMNIQGDGNVRWPQPLKPGTGNQGQYCHFHRGHGHDTEDCKLLQGEIERLIRQGYLARFTHNRPPSQLPARAGGQQQPQQVVGEIN